MATSKTTKVKKSTPTTLAFDVKNDIRKKPEGLTSHSKISLGKIDGLLSVIFHIIWILIGVFFLLVIVGQIKQGALKSVLGRTPSSSANATTPEAAPTETELPGVGTVNIDCTKQALSSEAIQKVLQAGGTSNLTADEKAKFAPCIVAAASPSPSASAAPKK